MNIPVNNFIVGQNSLVTLTDDQGNTFLLSDFGHLIEFDASADDTLIKVRPITNGGLALSRRIPHGWTGRMTFGKFNGLFNDYIALQEENFYNLGVQRFATMIVTVFNVDGSTSNYVFTRVVLHKPTFGTFRSDREVEITCQFEAQELQSNAVASTIGLPSVLTSAIALLSGNSIS